MKSPGTASGLVLDRRPEMAHSRIAAGAAPDRTAKTEPDPQETANMGLPGHAVALAPTQSIPCRR